MADNLAGLISAQATPIVMDLGYELADLELVKEGANWYLRFFIEHAELGEAITTDDCQKVSEKLSDWLDEADPIPQSYFLEVSSPGLERPLKTEKDFARFRGCMVQVGTYAPVHGGKLHIGRLGEVTESELRLTIGDHELTIERDKISSVRLHWADDREG